MGRFKFSLCVALSTALACSVVGCKKNSDAAQAAKKNEVKLVTKLESPVTHLYYNGKIEPIKTISVLSPVDGRVSQLNFEYGQEIQKKQLLVNIDSQSLADKYRSSISSYLTAKNGMSQGKMDYNSSVALHKAGLVDKSSYLSAVSGYQTKVIDFYQKRYSLEKVLSKVNMPPEKIEGLTLSDTNEINRLLNSKFQAIPVYATGAGVALFPLPSSGGEDGSNGGSLSVGSSVKAGQLILSIGDMSGLSATFSVSEVNVNRLHPNQKIVMTGVSFPGIRLKGLIKSVASQAKQSGGSNLGMFTVKVSIPYLSSAQRDIIHVGMTSKIDIGIKNPPAILLPIAAISQKNGQSVVTVLEKDGTRKTVPVMTGSTTMSRVMIEEGLKPGQTVVYTP